MIRASTGTPSAMDCYRPKHKKLEYSKRKKGLTLHHGERPSIMIIDRSEVVNDFQEEKKSVRMLEKNSFFYDNNNRIFN